MKVLGIDFETANEQRCSPCSVGLYLKDLSTGEVLLEKEYLINPECDFSQRCIGIHGIRPCDVVNAEIFPTIYNKIEDLIDGSTVVAAHNAKSMEMSVLNQTCSRYGLNLVPIRYICTMEASRKLLPDIIDHKLNTVADYFGIRFRHHNALEDARTCVEILECLMKSEDINDFIELYTPCACENPLKKKALHFSESTKALQELNGILLGVSCDEVLTLDETMYLNGWIEKHSELKGNYPYDLLNKELGKILEDNVIDEDELDGLLLVIQKVLDPAKCSCDLEEIDFCGKIVCLTGDFSCGSKSEVGQQLIEKGAEIKNSVSKSVDYLIVGDNGSDRWVQGTYGGKIKKAKELQAKGVSIEIITETAVFTKHTSFVSEPEETAYLSDIQSIIDRVCKSQGVDTKYILCEENKDKSYSVWIREPLELKKTQRVFSIARKNTKKIQRYDITVALKRLGDIGIPEEAEFVKRQESDSVILKFPLSATNMFEYLEEILNYQLLRFESSEKFGCCGKYIECSNAGKCIHEEQFYARSCYYRKNLEKGNIFYGEKVKN